jgi:hypothetical protein
VKSVSIAVFCSSEDVEWAKRTQSLAARAIGDAGQVRIVTEKADIAVVVVPVILRLLDWGSEVTASLRTARARRTFLVFLKFLYAS